MGSEKARNLTSNGAPSGYLPVHQPERVHVRTLEGLEDVGVHRVIKYLRSHIPLKETKVTLPEGLCTKSTAALLRAGARSQLVLPGERERLLWTAIPSEIKRIGRGDERNAAAAHTHSHRRGSSRCPDGATGVTDTRFPRRRAALCRGWPTPALGSGREARGSHRWGKGPETPSPRGAGRAACPHPPPGAHPGVLGDVDGVQHRVVLHRQAQVRDGAALVPLHQDVFGFQVAVRNRWLACSQKENTPSILITAV